MQIYRKFINRNPVLFKLLYNSVHFSSYLPSAGKGNVIPVPRQKSIYGEERYKLHSLLSSPLDGCVQHYSSAALSRERTAVPIEKEAEWAPQPVLTFWRKEKKSLGFKLPP